MEILFVGILVCLSLSFLLARSYKKRKKVFEQLSAMQMQKNDAKESKKYINNYVFSSIISCFSILILFFILFEFRDFFVSEKSNFDDSKSEIIILLDVSNSMNAQDVTVAGLEISRLNAAKRCINSILENVYNSNFGLVIFAGQAEAIIPISQDRIFAKQVLEAIETNFITNQGTNIEQGIDAAIQCFSATTENQTIILLSDVENHNGDIENAIRNLRAKNIALEVIGFGTDSGSKIPLGNGRFLTEFNGRDVITSLNFDVLRAISNDYYIYPFDLNLLVDRVNTTAKNSNDFFVLDSTFMALNLLLFLVFLSILLNIFFKQQII